MNIRFISIDMAFANMGLVRGHITPEGVIVPEDCKLIVTADERDWNAKKTTRKSSEELRRARVLVASLSAWAFDATIAFAEVPSGSQSASAARALGIAVGALASCPVPLIEVSPLEVKMCSVGSKTASKAQMVTWAMDKGPDLPWKTVKRGGKIEATLTNEHCADALAAAYAGVQTQDFKRLMQMMQHASTGIPVAPAEFKPSVPKVEWVEPTFKGPEVVGGHRRRRRAILRSLP